MGAVWFAVGVIVGMIALVVICCAIGDVRDDGYEQWRNSEYRNGKKDKK